MPDGKQIKKPYTPYGSDKVNLDSSGMATPKTYPKTRTMGQDPRTGKETITVKDTSGKLLYKKNNVAINGAKESNRFVSDSTRYADNAKYQASKINIGKVASKESGGPMMVSGKVLKKKPVLVNRKGAKMMGKNEDHTGCGCGGK